MIILKRTKEQIEFDLRMGVAGMTALKRWQTRHPTHGPLTPYETEEQRAAQALGRRNYRATYYVAHKRTENESSRRYALLHPDIRRANALRYRQGHRSLLSKRSSEYKKTHPDMVRRQKRRRVDRLSDGYVSSLFRQGTTLTSADVPPEIIVSHRSVLHAKRKLHQLRNPVAVQHPDADRAP